MVGLTFLDLGAENGASSAPPALQEFFRGARQFFPGPPNFSPSMLCGSNFLQRLLKNDDTPQSPLRYNFVDHPSVPIFFYARFHCKTLRDRVMRGLGYGSRIERSVVSSRLT
jgi:hypothetical protein